MDFGRERLLNEIVDSDPGRLRNNSSTPKGTYVPKIETKATANNKTDYGCLSGNEHLLHLFEKL